MQIIYQLPAKHPSAVPAVLWMQDSPQCRNWVTLQRWCAARTLGRVFLPYKSSIVLGDELWMLPRSWGELWKVDCLLCLSHLFWKGLDFQVDFTSFFWGGRKAETATDRRKRWEACREADWELSCRLLIAHHRRFLHFMKVWWISYFHTLRSFKRLILRKKKKKKTTSQIALIFGLPRCHLRRSLFLQGQYLMNFDHIFRRWRSWTSKKRLDFVVEKCLGVVFYQSVEVVNLSWRLICQQTNKKVKSFDPFFFGVADDAALCAGDVELIEIEGPILRLEMQGGHPSILPSRSASVCRGGEHLLCMNLCKYVECRNSMNNDIK